MPPFPLLRLPTLALAEILKCLNPVELFILAQCSQKASIIIPLSNSKKFILNCNVQSIITINGSYYFKAKRDNFYLLEDSVKSGRFRKIHTKLNCLIFFDQKITVLTFWKHELDGKKELCLYLSSLFKCPIDSIAFDISIPVDWFVDFVKQVTQNQREIQKVSISKTHDADLSAENLRKILDSFKNLEIISKLYINCPLEESFECTFNLFPKYLEICKANWFSKDNLLSIDNCELVDLTDSLLENEDLDAFLELWKAGRYSNLKYLSIRVPFLHLTDQKPIGGISNLYDPSNETIRSKNVCGRQCDIQGGVEIHRDNGQRADIRMYWDFGYHFTLFVNEESDFVREY